MIVAYFDHKGFHIFDLKFWDLLILNGFDQKFKYESAFCVWNESMAASVMLARWEDETYTYNK